MQIIENTTEFHIPYKTAIAIGKFDGIHRGHKELLKCLESAKKSGLKTAVFTFFPSPAAFFSKEELKELTTHQEKRALFEEMGIDYLVEYPFCKKTADVAPDRYVKEFLLDKMNGVLIVAGCDVGFGKGGKGDRRLLERLSLEYGFRLEIIDKLKYQEREISSTFVRNTPPAYGIYICGKVFKWLKKQGGLEAMKEYNEKKAKILYDFLDESKLFCGTVRKEDRSLMNVPFVTGNEELDAKFVKEAKEAGFENLKGHSVCRRRIIKGIRVCMGFIF